MKKTEERDSGRRVYFMHWASLYQTDILKSEISVEKKLMLPSTCFQSLIDRIIYCHERTPAGDDNISGILTRRKKTTCDDILAKTYE